MEDSDFEKISTIVAELKKVTNEMGFNADSLSYAMDMREKLINEGKNTEAIIVTTYLEAFTEDEEEDEE